MPKLKVCPLPGARRFFDRVAGLSYRPAVESRRAGRRRTSLHLAVAECVLTDAVNKGIAEVVWEDDIDADPEMNEGAKEVRCASIRQGGRTVASLCSIDDPTRDYARLVEAELASEAWPTQVNPLMAKIAKRNGAPVPFGRRQRR